MVPILWYLYWYPGAIFCWGSFTYAFWKKKLEIQKRKLHSHNKLGRISYLDKWRLSCKRPPKRTLEVRPSSTQRSISPCCSTRPSHNLTSWPQMSQVICFTNNDWGMCFTLFSRCDQTVTKQNFGTQKTGQSCFFVPSFIVLDDHTGILCLIAYFVFLSGTCNFIFCLKSKTPFTNSWRWLECGNITPFPQLQQ